MKKIEITHPDRILFPKAKLTKLDLATYYEKAAPLMLPLIKNRPISMKRYPEGIAKEGFFQKNAPKGAPKFLKTAKVGRQEKSPIQMIVCNDLATLLWMANMSCITPHIWLSKIDKPNLPDRMIFDLDPPTPSRFSLAKEGAFLLREILEKEYKLKPFVMTTGAKGLHVVVPIKRKYPFDKVRALAKEIAERLCEEDPKKFTTQLRKEKRKGRLFVDILRNAKTATVVAPYAVRPLPKAPIATPLSWEELKKADRSDLYTIATIARRLKKNPWQGIERSAKSLAL